MTLRFQRRARPVGVAYDPGEGLPKGTSEPGKAQVGTDGMTTSWPVPIEAYFITEGVRKSS